jgi:hypothetical protein
MLPKRLLIISTLAILVLPAAPVLAQDGSGDDNTTTTTTSSETENQNAPTSATTEQHRTGGRRVAEAENSSDSSKLRACRNREKSINNRLQNIAARGQRQITVFNTTATRVETFATDKNAQPSNYDALVQAVNDQKAAAQTAVSQIKSDSVNFKCDGSDSAKASLQIFKADLKIEITALKNYRTAIKNLIVGVKTSLSATAEGDHNATNQ